MGIFTKSSKINPKEAFLLWVKAGSLEGASEELRKMGKINLIRKKPFSRQSIWNSAVWYMMFNWEECKQYLPINSPEDEESWDRVITMKILNMSRRNPRDAAMLLEKYGFWEHARELVETEERYGDLVDFVNSNIGKRDEL